MRTAIRWALVGAAFLGAPATAQTMMDHSQHMAASEMQATVSEPGQGAFAAIGEIVALLMADPATDWDKVDIDALRAHLVDMDLVTTQASVTRADIEGGERFTVRGEGDVAGAVQRMVLAHAAFMDGTDGWHMTAEPVAGGAVLEVTVPEADRAKLAGLGFFGVLSWGMHHQAHHLAMATGGTPHQ